MRIITLSNIVIEARVDDGFVNATQLCKAEEVNYLPIG